MPLDMNGAISDSLSNASVAFNTGCHTGTFLVNATVRISKIGRQTLVGARSSVLLCCDADGAFLLGYPAGRSFHIGGEGSDGAGAIVCVGGGGIIAIIWRPGGIVNGRTEHIVLGVLIEVVGGVVLNGGKGRLSRPTSVANGCRGSFIRSLLIEIADGVVFNGWTGTLCATGSLSSPCDKSKCLHWCEWRST